MNMTTKRNNAGLEPRRWQPRSEMRDDLPFVDERLGPQIVREIRTGQDASVTIGRPGVDLHGTGPEAA
jgi:hypothetical protein